MPWPVRSARTSAIVRDGKPASQSIAFDTRISCCGELSSVCSESSAAGGGCAAAARAGEEDRVRANVCAHCWGGTRARGASTVELTDARPEENRGGARFVDVHIGTVGRPPPPRRAMAWGPRSKTRLSHPPPRQSARRRSGTAVERRRVDATSHTPSRRSRTVGSARCRRPRRRQEGTNRPGRSTMRPSAGARAQPRRPFGDNAQHGFRRRRSVVAFSAAATPARRSDAPSLLLASFSVRPCVFISGLGGQAGPTLSAHGCRL